MSDSEAAADRPAETPERKRRERPLKSASRRFAGAGGRNDEAFAPGAGSGGKGPSEPDTAPVPVIPPKWDELVVDAGVPNEGVVIKTGQASENEDDPEIASDEWRYPAPAKAAPGVVTTNGKKSRLRLRRRPPAER